MKFQLHLKYYYNLLPFASTFQIMSSQILTAGHKNKALQLAFNI